MQSGVPLEEAELNKSSAYKGISDRVTELELIDGVSPLDPIEVEDSITTYLALPLQVGEGCSSSGIVRTTLFPELNIEYQKETDQFVEGENITRLWRSVFKGAGYADVERERFGQLWTPAVFAS